MDSRHWHILHRRIGVTVAVFILLLSVTGFVTNHGNGLGLDKLYIENSVLLDWYNIEGEAPASGYRVASNWINQIGDRLYFNDHELEEGSGGLIGAVALPDYSVVALVDKLLLLTPEGELLEVLNGSSGGPHGLRSIGTNESGSPIVMAADGVYRLDPDALVWHKLDRLEGVAWSLPVEVPPELAERLVRSYRGRGLTVERVLLDIHSGRIFGSAGIYIVDLIALLFIFLALTGAWMWISRKLI